MRKINTYLKNEYREINIQIRWLLKKSKENVIQNQCTSMHEDVVRGIANTNI